MKRHNFDRSAVSDATTRFETKKGHQRILRGSVFAKYISAFVLILFASFLILSFIITGAIQRYFRISKSNYASASATETARYLEENLKHLNFSDLESYLKEDRLSVSAMLSVICKAADEDMLILLTDDAGRVVLYADRGTVAEAENISIPEGMLRDVVKGLEISHIGNIGGLSGEKQLVKASVVKGADGRMCGAVFACAGSGTMKPILSAILHALILAGVTVLLAAFCVVYFITERIIGPLREMSRAAHRFAAGDFDVTVPVKGQDEVAELAIAFNQMAESLKNLEKMRSTFMANVSHDLRTPMMTISGFIDNILSGAIPREKQAHYLEIVLGEVKRLSRLVSLILDISRIQAGDRKFVMEPFDICETARLILISFENRIDEKRLEVSFDADSDNVIVYADRDAIHQILYNICDNAIKFSKDGGRLDVAIRIQREKKKVQVTVFNEGQGIPEEDIPYIFDQFYKADKSRGLDKSGVGLGMFISKAIVDAHRESIFVHSEYGKNCEFGFTLSMKPHHEDKKHTLKTENAEF